MKQKTYISLFFFLFWSIFLSNSFVLIAQNTPNNPYFEEVDTLPPFLLHQYITLQGYQDTINLADSLLLDSVRQATISARQLDSLLRATAEADSALAHQMNDPPLIIQPFKTKQNDSTVFYVLLFITTIFIFVKYTESKYMRGIYQSFRSLNLAQQFFEDYGKQISIPTILLMLNVCLVFSTYCFLLLRHFGKLNHWNESLLLLCITIVVGGIMFLKSLMLYFLKKILPIGKTIRFYSFNARLISIILSIILVPFLYLLSFANSYFIYITLLATFVSILFFVTYMYYRGFEIGKAIIMFHKFHFFLYLCTVEIVPAIIVYKTIAVSIF